MILKLSTEQDVEENFCEVCFLHIEQKFSVHSKQFSILNYFAEPDFALVKAKSDICIIIVVTLVT